MAIISGTASRDTLRGGSGNDELYGYDGWDRLYGGAGDDLLNGGQGNDRIDGGEGNDSYVFYADDGRDIIKDASGQEKLYFKTVAGLQYFQIARLSNDDVRITIGNDIVTIDDGSYAHARFSLFYGTSDQALGSLVIGSSAADNLLGSSSNDLLKGGAGSDTLAGGDGDDAYIFTAGDGNDIINDAEGDNAIYFKSDEDAGYATLDDTNFAKDGDNLVITAYAGGQSQTVTITDFYLASTSFTIHYNSGAGDKFVTVAQNALTPAVNSRGSEADDLLTGDIGNDNLVGAGGDDILEGGEGNDVLYGSEGWDELYGEDGDDILDGGAGWDVLEGGAGDDVYRFHAADEVDYIFDSQGDNRIEFLSSSNGVYSSLVSPHFARGGNDLTITITIGNEEQEVIIADYYLQGVNFEIYYDRSIGGNLQRVADGVIAGAIVGVIEDTPLTLNGGDGNDLLEGRSHDDVLDGAAGDDTLNGLAGADTISGGDGNDIIDGGRGNDTLNGGAGDDSYIFQRGDGTDSIIDISGQENLYFKDATADSLVVTRYYSRHFRIVDRYASSDIVNIEHSTYEHGRYSVFYGADDTLLGNLYVGAFDRGNTIVASGDAAWLTGGYSTDRLFGSYGDDRIYGWAGSDTLYGGDGNDVIYGGNDGDTLYGGRGSNQLYGEDGDDTIYGGAGADLIDGGEGEDWLSYFESADEVTVNLASGRGNGGDAEGDNINNIENLAGSQHDDVLIGDAGNNKIAGGTGDDSLQGAGGDDTYQFYAGQGSDVISDKQGDNIIHFINSTISGVAGGTASYARGSLTFSKSDDGEDLIIDATAGVYQQQVTIDDYYLLPDDAIFTIYYGSSTIRYATLVTAEDIPI